MHEEENMYHNQAYRDNNSIGQKWIKISSLRASITRTLHAESKHPTQTKQANPCNRLHTAEISVKLGTVLKLKLTRCEKWK